MNNCMQTYAVELLGELLNLQRRLEKLIEDASIELADSGKIQSSFGRGGVDQHHLPLVGLLLRPVMQSIGTRAITPTQYGAHVKKKNL